MASLQRVPRQALATATPKRGLSKVRPSPQCRDRICAVLTSLPFRLFENVKNVKNMKAFKPFDLFLSSRLHFSAGVVASS